MRGVVNGRGHISGSIRHRECAPGLVCHRGSRVTASVRLRQRHPIRRVAAGSGGGDPRVIRLREYKSIQTHGFGGDITHGQGVVQGTFRTIVILYPLR